MLALVQPCLDHVARTRMVKGPTRAESVRKVEAGIVRSHTLVGSAVTNLRPKMFL